MGRASVRSHCLSQMQVNQEWGREKVGGAATVPAMPLSKCSQPSKISSLWVNKIILSSDGQKPFIWLLLQVTFFILFINLDTFSVSPDIQ